MEIRSNKTVIYKKSLTNLYEMNSTFPDYAEPDQIAPAEVKFKPIALGLCCFENVILLISSSLTYWFFNNPQMYLLAGPKPW